MRPITIHNVVSPTETLLLKHKIKKQLHKIINKLKS